ncbi:hypothetical protein QBC37DRAFT_284212 [Rhypophila decipiens]|uniref:Heterokaryon incompatibility domain-containing protein n=1 Tax=Rhypophila decipiens TaxID=261697 RepID=A0AAN6Y8V2_9PEZI|nr:hypothetical protein QBC37DRAFT_284212 [Rhypophila decipiens]
MDTLAIPVSPDKNNLDLQDLKARAIRQIYHVYNNATRVVVIDKDLCQELAPRPFHTILKVLSSAWMQRLWTLQEAFLSRNLLVAFRSDAPVKLFGGLEFEFSGQIQVGLQNLDNLIKQLDRPQDSHTTAMAELIKRKLVNNLMGEDREIRNRNDHPIETRGSMVIASAWRSSRWRNTSRLEDETLALSTLLNLDYRDTKIEDNVKKTVDGDDKESERNEKLEGMMEAFWSLINKNYEGSIPAGLIFLPGERLSGPGFGWAPKTWMSASDEKYPYPLGIPSKPTELHNEGLLVQYPGFLLQCGHPNRILGTNLTKSKSTLAFPIDQNLSEWYHVRPLEEARTEFDPARMMFSKSHGTSQLEFGIILSRPKPREWPDEEIGLLVHIWRETWKRKEPERISRKYLYSQIVRHVLVSRRSTVREERKHYQLPAGKLNDQPIGEAMPEDTLWYVDGYRQDRDQPRIPDQSRPAATQNDTDAKVLLGKKNDAFQGFNIGGRTWTFGSGSRNQSASPELAKTPSFTGNNQRGFPSVATISEVGDTPTTPDKNDLQAQKTPSTTEKTSQGRPWFWQRLSREGSSVGEGFPTT